MHRRFTATAVTFVAAATLAIATSTWSGAASAAGPTARPGVKLVKVSHDPYKKDGRSTLGEARLVLCLPFSPDAPRHEVSLEVTTPASTR